MNESRTFDGEERVAAVRHFKVYVRCACFVRNQSEMRKQKRNQEEKLKLKTHRNEQKVSLKVATDSKNVVDFNRMKPERIFTMSKFSMIRATLCYFIIEINTI